MIRKCATTTTADVKNAPPLSPFREDEISTYSKSFFLLIILKIFFG